MKIYSFIMKNITRIYRNIATFLCFLHCILCMVIKMNASEMREQQLCEVIRVHMEEADTKRLFYLGIYEGAIIRLIQKRPFKILICFMYREHI